MGRLRKAVYRANFSGYRQPEENEIRFNWVCGTYKGKRSERGHRQYCDTVFCTYMPLEDAGQDYGRKVRAICPECGVLIGDQPEDYVDATIGPVTDSQVDFDDHDMDEENDLVFIKRNRTHSAHFGVYGSDVQGDFDWTYGESSTLSETNHRMETAHDQDR